MRRIAVAVLACAFSLQLAACVREGEHVSSIVLFKDKSGTIPAASFAESDSVFARSRAVNVTDKASLHWQTIAVNVRGQAPNYTIPEFDRSYDVDKDEAVYYGISAPARGWPPGTYKIVLTMSAGGREIDVQTVGFTVSGR